MRKNSLHGRCKRLLLDIGVIGYGNYGNGTLTDRLRHRIIDFNSCKWLVKLPIPAIKPSSTMLLADIYRTRLRAFLCGCCLPCAVRHM